MSTLCTGFERWGMRLRGNERFRGPNGDQHGLRSQEPYCGPSDLTAWPIAPAHRLSRNRRGGWCLFSRRRRLVRLGGQGSTSWRRRGARPEDGAHPARLLGGTGFLTLFAQWTRAAMANAGGIQHAQRAVALRPAFLQVQRMARWAAQRPIGLRGKCGTRKSMRKGGLRKYRWPIRRQRGKSRSATSRQIQLFQARQTKVRDQRERFRQREERCLGGREEAFHQEEGHHREEAEIGFCTCE